MTVLFFWVYVNTCVFRIYSNNRTEFCKFVQNFGNYMGFYQFLLLTAKFTNSDYHTLNIILFWVFFKQLYRCTISMSGICVVMYSAARRRWHCKADFSVHSRQMRSRLTGASPAVGWRAANNSRYKRS